MKGRREKLGGWKKPRWEMKDGGATSSGWLTDDDQGVSRGKLWRGEVVGKGCWWKAGGRIRDEGRLSRPRRWRRRWRWQRDGDGDGDGWNETRRSQLNAGKGRAGTWACSKN